jgi:glycosyltransferase involved in cell wall biosynthesis
MTDDRRRMQSSSYLSRGIRFATLRCVATALLADGIHDTAARIPSHAPWPIVLLTQSLDLGGSERQLATLAMSLDRRVFDPTVACFDCRGVRGDDLRRAGVPVVEFPVRSFIAPHTAAVGRRLYSWLRQRHIVLAHAFDVPTAAFAVPLARAARVPVVLSSQRGDRRLFGRGIQRVLRVADHLADAIVVNSDYVRRVLVAEFGVADESIRICRNGLDVGVFHPDDEDAVSVRSARLKPRATTAIARGRTESGLLVGIVAALRAEKSIETLIDAFAQLADPQHRLVIVGDGPCKTALEARARERGLKERCSFVSATSDVASWYRAIDVFVLPSLNESFSNSLMEAMACGCAVVASNVGGNPELVRDGENGLLFEGGNAGDLARRLELVLGDAERRHRLGAAAVRTIRESYTNEASADRFAALYESMIGARAQG